METEGDSSDDTSATNFYVDNFFAAADGTAIDGPNTVVAPPPTVSYTPGDSSVNLTWTTVSGAEKYAVCGYTNGKWQKIAETNDNSYTIKGLLAGNKYHVAVIAMTNGKWNNDFSNMISVVPGSSSYPSINYIAYNDVYHQFQLKWNYVSGATQYGVAVKLGGKWKVQAYTDNVIFTSPKLRPGSTYEMVVCAKINGKWDISNINARAFKVTVE